MTTPKYTEVQLAESIVAWLERDGWEVFQEVDTLFGLVDIVAKQGNILWAIECKKAFGFPVLEQAHRMIGHVHYVSVAVGASSRWRSLGVDICGKFGIGIVSAGVYNANGPPCFDIQERVKPKLFRKIGMIPELRDEQKVMAKAGGNRGGHWTVFKGTKETMINMVKKTQGIPFKELIDKLDHHYATTASARSCLSKLIGTSAIPELKTEHRAGVLCVVMS